MWNSFMMVRLWCGSDPHKTMDPSCHQSIKQVIGGSIIVWSIFMYHVLVLSVCLNKSLASNGYVALLHDHLYLFMNSMYLNNDRLIINRIMRCVIRPK